jgi:sugar lactone lactonase YvrE
MGLECFDPRGQRVGAIETTEVASNLCFGGADGASLLIALATSAYIVSLEAS